ncbi:AcrR family transcriptional regulator [Paenibacillus sp. SORGH_AS306]|uniref:TetR/AcrR family transcriptional regulator n=1 Tax=unclassified Paenibacillus TaxID=185978 RepID=UPI0027881A5C|nr:MULTISPECIES: TetR/AcrR family transcriptional regulator [unclassified Paenibacillus]MDQ1234129.1 AcrR family transcriptional regulator [Paenibacillus sp. SORGH_AS_0306]MDR6111173.1 AcrR family transcriptional regulator [Paenibacillus sp. SORGH_AS_0338]
MSQIDRRVRKSQKAIKLAIIDLMIEKKFDQITIQDIADQADVSRRTIYLHYTDKFDLLDKLIQEHIEEMRDICNSQDMNDSYVESGLLWFEYFESQYSFFSAMLASKGSSFFRTRFLAFFLQELEQGILDQKKQPLTEEDYVDIQFLGAAILGIVEWWIKHEKPHPPAFMAKRLGLLLERHLEVDVYDRPSL